VPRLARQCAAALCLPCAGGACPALPLLAKATDRRARGRDRGWTRLRAAAQLRQH
jgi:hypothetical protein